MWNWDNATEWVKSVYMQIKYIIMQLRKGGEMLSKTCIVVVNNKNKLKNLNVEVIVTVLPRLLL